MPDPTKQTISATQSPALFGVSPYYTRWMLYKHFADDMPIDSDANSRMKWGRALQPLVMVQATEDLRLEIIPNNEDVYIRDGRLGCTKDADIICPERGPGALDAKCVFDYTVWMNEWNGGKQPPKHIEIQVQQQMLVGDGNGTPYKWGMIAVWVCGEMKYFERKPVAIVQQRLVEESEKFFDDLAAKRVPDPVGSPMETSWLAEAFPVIEGKVLDLREHPKARELAEHVAMYARASKQRLMYEKIEQDLKAKILAVASDAQRLEFLHGIKVDLQTRRTGEAVIKRKAFVSKVIKPYVPENIPDDLLAGG